MKTYDTILGIIGLGMLIATVWYDKKYFDKENE